MQAEEREQLQALFRHLSKVTLRLCRSNVIATLPEELLSPKTSAQLQDVFFFFHCVESKAIAVNLLRTFDVKISRRFCGGLCDGVSSVKVTISCNQSLFTEILLCLFHNNPPTLPPSFQTVAVM